MATPDPGAYVLFFRLRAATTCPVGRLGVSTYPEGWYAYVGSALGGLAARTGRHLRPRARPHWHIDYLLPHGDSAFFLAAHTRDRVECRLADHLARRFAAVPRFGSSDCRCPGHLFRSDARRPIVSAAAEAIRCAGCRPVLVPGGQGPVDAGRSARGGRIEPPPP